MSLGHMTEMEQLITMGGLYVTLAAFLMVLEAFGQGPAALTFVVGLVLISIGKAWCWKHTAYDGSWNNPVWVSGKGGDD